MFEAVLASAAALELGVLDPYGGGGSEAQTAVATVEATKQQAIIDGYRLDGMTAFWLSWYGRLVRPTPCGCASREGASEAEPRSEQPADDER
jgi:hypothetical protein